MRFLFIADPLDKINIHHDSSIALMREAQARKHQVYFAETDGLSLSHQGAQALAQTLRVQKKPSYDLGKFEAMPLKDFDAILMRRDPPVNEDYLYSCMILENACSFVTNRPASLRMIHEKFSALRYYQWVPETLITKSLDNLRAFAKQYAKVILKPVDGFGGRSIFLTAHDDKNFAAVVETLTDHGEKYVIVQEYLSAVETSGDHRILLIDGKPYGAIARVPIKGDHRGNMARGASVDIISLSKKEQELCEEIGPDLIKEGIHFAGLDVIGNRLTEINVTSPTGMQEVEKYSKLRPAKKLIEVIEKNVS